MFAHTKVLPQTLLLPAAKKGEGRQCSTIYPFQTRLDLEKDQSQLAGNEKPNKLFYCLIIHITQNLCQWQLACFLSCWDLGCTTSLSHREMWGFWNWRLVELLVFKNFCLGLSTLTPPCSLAQQQKWSHPAGACTASSFPRDPPHPSPHINEQLTNKVNGNKLATNFFW